MYANAVIRRASELAATGLSDYGIAKQVGVARQTVARWRRGGFVERERPATGWVVAGPEYAYLLGLYLGDGCLQKPGRSRSYTLDIACDLGYPAIIREAGRAVGATFGTRIRQWRHPDHGCVHLRTTHPALGSAFPQHGPGRKHQRKIKLIAWQRALTHRHPEEFIRGLIHSDGSRCINRFDTQLPSGRVAHYEYVRYFFTNYSRDIRQIFCEHCELLGIRWTQSNARNISIAHRDSVAFLDRIVGPKT